STAATQFVARVASGADSGTSGVVEVHLDSPSSAAVGSFVISNTGGMQSWVTRTVSISPTTGTHTVYLVFTSASTGHFVNINWFNFTKTAGSVDAYTTIQAESFTSKTAGPQTEPTTDTGGGLDIGHIRSGDWLAYNNVNFG